MYSEMCSNQRSDLWRRSMEPPNPCYYRSAGSLQILKFYDYGPQIQDRYNVYSSLQKAAREVRGNVLQDVMGLRERKYDSADVLLLLHPGPTMTWGMWEEAIKGVTEFVSYYEALDLDFDIIQTREVIGKGTLTAFD